MRVELGLSFQHKLNAFEKRALRRIFGPKRRMANIMSFII
jgi:hypothetical protein